MTEPARGNSSAVGPSTHRRRIRILGAAFCLAAAGYLARGVYVQAFQAEHWKALARAQHASRVEVPAERGGIYDRSGRPLAVDAELFRAFLAPGETKDLDRAVDAVSRILGLAPRERAKLRRAENGWVAIPRQISATDRDRLAAAVRQGIHFRRLAARDHPEAGLARNVLGAVSDTGAGRSGLELALDSLLRGHPGAMLTRRDGLGKTHPLPDGQIEPPRPGYDVHLTIDVRLQTIAENALEHALEKTGASGGDILLTDVGTGEILAVASRRESDGPGAGVPAFTDPYEPGSTAKPFLLAALLAENAVDVDERIDVEGGEYRTETGRLVRDVHEADTLSVGEIIQYSSNVGAVKLSRRLQPGHQYRYLRDFGFGTPTGVLYPSESPGRLRKPDAWSALSQGSLAMGYELSVTSVQLAAAYGALANGGELIRPYLVREVRRPSGEVAWRREVERIRRIVSPEIAGSVTRVLARVVEEGTATRAAMSSLHVAGKTSTVKLATGGRYDGGRYSASFVGYTPAEDPRLLILTRLVDPQGHYYGGLTAAPLSRATLEAALATRGVVFPRQASAGSGVRRVSWGSPQRWRSDRRSGKRSRARGARGGARFAMAGEPAGASSREDGERPAGDGAGLVLPDLRGLSTRAAVRRLHELGLHVRLRGGGEVSAQDPSPGVPVKAGATVVIR